MTHADAFGLVSQGVMAAAVLRTATLVVRRNGPREGRPPRGWVFAVVVAACLLLPVPAESVAREMRALWGDPSAVTAILLALYAARPRALPALPRPASLLAFGTLAGAALLGPTFTGSHPWGIDLHAWGFRAWPVLVVTVAWMALAWRRGAPAWVAVAGAALALWGCGFVQSDNAWDALVDPWLVGWAVVMGVGGLLARGGGGVGPGTTKRKALGPSASE
jgi:hypothetical protein